MNKNILIGIVLVLAVLGGYLLLQKNKSPEISTAMNGAAEEIIPEESTQAVSPAENGANQEVVDYTINLKNFSFTPNVIEAEPGQTIKVKLVTTQGLHDFMIDELAVRSNRISEGNEETVEISVPSDTASGTEYEFYCSVGNHRAQGMIGVFRVK